MILNYGGYAHGNNEVSLTITRDIWRDEYGRRRGYNESWTITGRKRGSGTDLVASLTLQLAALKAAYANDNQNVILYESDGATATTHALYNSDSYDGIHVTNGPSFPSGQGAEYATYRDYTITVSARFETEDDFDTLSFIETIAMTGTGGKRFVVIPTLTGTPVKQDVAERTPCTLSQEGTALGASAYPAVPAPVSADDEHVDQRQIIRRSPRKQADGTYKEYEISWRYVFEKNAAFSDAQATPSTWTS